MSNMKLGVEVVGATNLMPKDSDGSANPFVELQFDNQRFRTAAKEKDLNPQWNELFFFQIGDPAQLPLLSLEASVYSHSRSTKTRFFLGKVQIHGISFVHRSDAAVMQYPLQKRGIFSRIKGELALKVYLTDDPFVKPSNPLPAINLPPPPPAAVASYMQAPPPMAVSAVEDPNEKKHVFRSIPHTSTEPPPPPPPVQATPPPPAPPPAMTRFVAPLQTTPYQPLEYVVRETAVVGQPSRPTTHDLVERMQYLYVRVVKARDLPAMDVTGSLDPYVEVIVGNYRGRTKTFEKNKTPEWNEVFAFSRERLQTSVLELRVNDKDYLKKDDFVGAVRFDLHDVPTRVPPDSPLAPEWYRLEGKKGGKVQGELMAAVWVGTQADEAFPTAWHSDAVESSDSLEVSQHTRSKVYHSPRLWYVRINVIEVQDVVAGDRNRFPELLVKAKLGNQVLQTRSTGPRSLNPRWDEEFVLVAAEPFEDSLVVSVEDRVGPNKDEVVGCVAIHLGSVERRVDDRPVNPRWYALEKTDAAPEAKKEERQFASRIHLRVCLDGGYHVFDESTYYTSDLRPSSKQLWKPAIGLLELGINSADGFHPQKTRDGRGVADTYCVAKYGRKWVRTRTVVDNLSPKYNEQYNWEVYDPSTVLTVAVFDNGQVGGKGSNGKNGNKDLNIGKVRIRLSTLQTGRAYVHAYPLIALHPSGVKKMGELKLAVRFTSTSLPNLLGYYSRPLLPKMHYLRPFPVVQQDNLRQQAVGIVAARLGRMEPPLRREVVECMCDTASHAWSVRKSKANFNRLTAVFSSAVAFAWWFRSICAWERPLHTVATHVFFVFFIFLPDFVLPSFLVYLFMSSARNYWYRSPHPPHMDVKVSCAENVHPDELDEEFDGFPSSRNLELVRFRYDRLRVLAGRVQTLLGDLAAQGERVQALVSWRDPRATALFMLFCLLGAVVLFAVPLQVLVAIAGLYVMRHPRFRGRMPPVLVNFFRRLPSRTDSLL